MAKINMIKQSIKALMLLSLLPLIAYADLHFEEIAPPSLADHTHLSHKDPVDGGWLPQLTGLPNKDQVDMLTQHVLAIIEEDQDKQCTAIDLNLRMMIFQHFLIYQHIVNSQDIYFDEQIAQQWAHVLAMILKESSGDSTNITDMLGHSISTFEPKTNLQQWNQILNLTKQKKNRTQLSN